MAGELSKCDCCKNATDEEKFQILLDGIKQYEGREGCLIQVLHLAQRIFGYLPLEVQEFVAKNMNIPLSEVSGVVSFYSFFTSKPHGEHVIRICLGTGCYVSGSSKLIPVFEDLLGVKLGETTPNNKFTLEAAFCLGACGLAPAVMIDDEVYKCVTPDMVKDMLAKY